jgi:hypothetical protein
MAYTLYIYIYIIHVINGFTKALSAKKLRLTKVDLFIASTGCEIVSQSK